MALNTQESGFFNEGFTHKGKKKVRPAGCEEAFPIFKKIGLRKEASWPPFFWMKHGSVISTKGRNLTGYLCIGIATAFQTSQ
jgi:hypothetical protein